MMCSTCVFIFLPLLANSSKGKMAQGNRVYSNIDPRCEWVPSVEFDTLLVDLADFKKEDLKAQVDAARNLTISGERNTKENKRCRFKKTFQLAKECDIRGITANFDNGILYMIVPKPTSSRNDSPHEDGNGKGRKDEPSLKENNDGLQHGNYNQLAWSWSNLAKQKQVILSVVIALLLVVLILFFTTYTKTSQPHNSTDARS